MDDVNDPYVNEEQQKLLNVKEHENQVEKQETFETESKYSILDPNIPVIRIFKAYTEDWEKRLCHSYHPLSQFTLLAKYQNIKYVFPGKTKSIPFYVCNDSLI